MALQSQLYQKRSIFYGFPISLLIRSQRNFIFIASCNLMVFLYCDIALLATRAVCKQCKSIVTLSQFSIFEAETSSPLVFITYWGNSKERTFHFPQLVYQPWLQKVIGLSLSIIIKFVDIRSIRFAIILVIRSILIRFAIIATTTGYVC